MWRTIAMTVAACGMVGMTVSTCDAQQKRKERASAPERLAAARKARAVWRGFPGFAAQIIVHDDGQKSTGKISVDAEGKVSIVGLPDETLAWVKQRLESLVQHRMPGGSDDSADAVYADKRFAHPLGRLIRVGDGSSTFRVRGDTITQVNRSAGPMKFTISVIGVSRNAEKKYLPGVYSVTFWDAKSGEVRTTSVVRNRWKRVGAFDLPLDVLIVTTSAGGKQRARRIHFEQIELTGKSS